MAFSAPRRIRAEWIWAPLVMLGVTFFLYRSIWFPAAGREPEWLGWDCLESFWPDLSYYAGALRHGEFPLWNPFDRGGYAFYGDPHPGVYYPVTWLFVVPGAIAGAMPPWTIQVKALLQIALTAMLIHAYLRSRRLPAAAAALGGVAWIVSGPAILHKASALNWPLTWMPLVWIAVDRLVERAPEPGWWRRAAALAGAIALAGSAGPPPGFFYLLVTTLIYGGWRLARALLAARRDARLRPELVAQARGLALAAAATAAMLAIIVLPGFELAADSATRGVARDLTYATHGALSPGAALVGMVAPAGGTPHTYLGIIVMALTVVALVASARADGGAPVVLAAIAAFMIVLTFGGHTPILPWLVEHVPGFGLFREPNRYKCVAAMVLAMCAGHGLTALWERRRRALAGLAAAVWTMLVAVIVVHVLAPPPQGAGFVWSYVALGVGGALLAAIALVPPRARAPLAAAAIVALYVDATKFGEPMLRSREGPVDDQEDRRFLAGLGDVEREHRIYDEFVMEQRPGSRLRVRDFRGYPSGDPFDDARYAEVRARLGQNPELLAAFNVRWVLHGPHHRNGLTKNFIARPPDALRPGRFRRLDARRFEVIAPAPLVAWYGAARLAVAKGQALAALLEQERAQGTRLRAVIEEPDVPPALKPAVAALAAATPAEPVAGEIVTYGANRVRVRVSAPGDGIVVLNEKMAPGWRVTVDGRPATPLRANYLLRAVLVPAGEHTIEWTFSPPRYPLLLGLWLAGVGLVAAAGVAAWRARRSQRNLGPA